MPASDLSVSTLLQDSRAANLDRIRAGNSRPPNYPIAEQHAANALSLRLQAHELDPDHTDPEWQNDKGSHADICAFLAKYPSIP